MIWIALIASYLLGGLPFSYWLVRWQRPGSDLRLMGSGNPGATNALRVGGKQIGLLTLALDILKGWLAVEVSRRLGIDGTWLGACAAAAVVGHVAPIWIGFRGGKGVATAGGSLLSLAPWAVVAAAIVFTVVVWTTRIVALGSVSAALTLPLAYWLTAPPLYPGPPMIGWIFVIALLVVGRHRSNMRRWWAGDEARLGVKLEDL